MVPMWVTQGEGLESVLTDQHRLRPICLGLIDSHIEEDAPVLVEVRGKSTQAVVVPFHLRSDAPPYARPILYGHKAESKTGDETGCRHQG